MLETIAVTAPYPGLRPFEPHEAEIFFGRETHTDRLLEILQRERFLAVVGPSGSGKSSLVRAGLLPSLRLGALGSGSDWRIALFRPGDRPIRNLAVALLQSDVFGGDLQRSAGALTEEDVAMLSAELRRGPLGLLHATSNMRDAASREGINLLVVVDQFEEIFTYAEASGESADESDALINLLLAARSDPTARVYVVLTMRTDFLGNCVRFVELPDAINRAQYLTPRLKRNELERAIVGPAEVFGGSVDASLVSELINSISGNSDELPLLQHALARMWGLAARRSPIEPRIEWNDADAVGGLAGALDQHAELVLKEVLAAIGAGQERLVAGLFCAITERRTAAGGGQDVRRPQTLARIAKACRAYDWTVLVPIVKAYADVSLLQHGRTLDEHSVIDLSHEALMRQWSRLRGWLDAESRRAADYRRWAERASDHANNRGGLLEGAALARAVEWLAGDNLSAPVNALGLQFTGVAGYSGDDGVPSGRPTAEWAARYAVSSDAAGEFAQTMTFIEQSADAAHRKETEERDRRERERRDAIERAKAAERAVKAARLRLVLMTGFVVVLVAVCGAALYFYFRASAEAQRADQALQRSERLQAQVDQIAIQQAQLSNPAGNQFADYRPSTPILLDDDRALSMADLGRIMPDSSPAVRAAFLRPLNDAMGEFAINTRLRQAHFLGQMAYESGDLMGTEEKWTGAPYQLRYEPPSSLAQALGNVEPGDGERYRGRGLIWIVGRGNYKKYGDALGLDLVSDPDLAARPDVAVRTAGLYWKLTRLNEFADKDDLAGITQRIKGPAMTSLARREAKVNAAKAVLGVVAAAGRGR